MIVAISRLTVTNGNADGLAQQYLQRSHLVDQMEGFISMEVLRHADNPCEFLVYTRWETRAHFDAYYRQQAFRQAHRNIGQIEGGVRVDRETKLLDVYEVITT